MCGDPLHCASQLGRLTCWWLDRVCLAESDNCFRVLAVKCSAKLADVNPCRRQKEKVEHGLHQTEAYIRTSLSRAQQVMLERDSTYVERTDETPNRTTRVSRKQPRGVEQATLVQERGLGWMAREESGRCRKCVAMLWWCVECRVMSCSDRDILTRTDSAC